MRFAGADYVAGEPTEATYTFNSYRLSYRYRVHSGARTTGWVGFTAKIRDAVTALEQGPTASLDIDALAGGPGRAEDAALKLGYEVGDGWTVQAGYRMVEGGADVDQVYAFAWLHYAVASVVWRP
ncbi:MAG: hypothetical protein WD995_04220 [Gemmatimonadota bacterium]